MFQLKMSAAIFVVVLALMGFAYFALTDNVTESIVRSETSELSMARRSVSSLPPTSTMRIRPSLSWWVSLGLMLSVPSVGG